MTNTTLTTIQFSNEKGNALPKVREAVKNQAVDAFIPEGFELAENGSYVKAVAIDEFDNEPVYVTLSMTVTKNYPTKKERKPSKKNKATEEVSVPELF